MESFRPNKCLTINQNKGYIQMLDYSLSVTLILKQPLFYQFLFFDGKNLSLLFWENFENWTPTFIMGEGRVPTIFMLTTKFNFSYLCQCSFVLWYVFYLFSHLPFLRIFITFADFYFMILLFYVKYILCSWK